MGDHCNRLDDTTSQLSARKKRKVEDTDGEVQESRDQNDWEKLFKELQAERVTKAEELLHSYVRESEEREKLMRSYNQDLEAENQVLRSKLSSQPEQHQQLQDLKKQLEDLQSKLSNQTATIQVYEKLTATTVTVNDNNREHQNMDCDCTVLNPDTKGTTKFRISTVSEGGAGQLEILKFSPLENPQPLPEFLQEEIEFPSSQLPPLLQNVLRGMYPDEDDED